MKRLTGIEPATRICSIIFYCCKIAVRADDAAQFLNTVLPIELQPRVMPRAGLEPATSVLPAHCKIAVQGFVKPQLLRALPTELSWRVTGRTGIEPASRLGHSIETCSLWLLQVTILRILTIELPPQRGKFYHIQASKGSLTIPTYITPTSRMHFKIKPSAGGSISPDLNTIAVPSAKYTQRHFVIHPVANRHRLAKPPIATFHTNCVLGSKR